MLMVHAQSTACPDCHARYTQRLTPEGLPMPFTPKHACTKGATR